MAKFSTLAASLRYGHSLWFACRIEGIPVIFTEHNPTGNPSTPRPATRSIPRLYWMIPRPLVSGWTAGRAWGKRSISRSN